MDLEGFNPKSESESEEDGFLFVTFFFVTLAGPGFLGAVTLAPQLEDSALDAAFLDLEGAFSLVRTSMMVGCLSETSRGK